MTAFFNDLDFCIAYFFSQQLSAVNETMVLISGDDQNLFF